MKRFLDLPSQPEKPMFFEGYSHYGLRKNSLYEGHGFSRAVIVCALDGFSR
jgi:hypothetical protein